MNIICSIFSSSSSSTSGISAPSKKKSAGAEALLSRWQISLAKDIFRTAMSYLEPKDVARCEKTCKKWNKTISPLVWKTQCLIQKVTLISSQAQQVLKDYASNTVTPINFDGFLISLISEYEGREAYPNGFYKQQFANPNPPTAFGHEQWNRYFGDIGTPPRLPPSIHKILQSPCPFVRGMTVEQTHMLVLIPATLKRKFMGFFKGNSMTLGRIGELMSNLHLKHGKTNYDSHSYYFLKQHSERPFEPSHWVLMTKGVLKKSIGLSYEKQKTLIAEYHNYHIPKLSEAIVSIFMEYVTTGIYRFDDDPRTFTRCQEEFEYNAQMIVGAYMSKGLSVNYFFNEPSVYLGIAALRKF